MSGIWHFLKIDHRKRRVSLRDLAAINAAGSETFKCNNEIRNGLEPSQRCRMGGEYPGIIPSVDRRLSRIFHILEFHTRVLRIHFVLRLPATINGREGQEGDGVSCRSLCNVCSRLFLYGQNVIISSAIFMVGLCRTNAGRYAHTDIFCMGKPK